MLHLLDGPTLEPVGRPLALVLGTTAAWVRSSPARAAIESLKHRSKGRPQDGSSPWRADDWGSP